MNLKEKAYKTIKERILEGVYGPGEMLNEKKIIEELQISRTPFRDAINQLEWDGLVEIRPNHGFFVQEASVKDTMEIFDVRFLLEPSVAELATYRISGETIANLRERTREALNGTVEEMLRIDEQFHRTVLYTIENTYLIRTMENIYGYFRISNAKDKRASSVAPSLTEHLAILEAFEEHDPDLARERTKEHLIRSRRRAVGLLF